MADAGFTTVRLIAVLALLACGQADAVVTVDDEAAPSVCDPCPGAAREEQGASGLNCWCPLTPWGMTVMPGTSCEFARSVWKERCR